MTADVELTALLDALIAAGPAAVGSMVQLYTYSLPTAFQNLVQSGKFARLVVLAASAAALTVVTPIAPFAAAFVDELPLPLGTSEGLVNQAFKLAYGIPVETGLAILKLVADIFDNGLSPADMLTGAIGHLTDAVADTIESLGKIVAAFAGALPILALKAPADVVEEPQLSLSAAGEPVALAEANVVPASVTSSSAEGPTDVVTVTVDASESETSEEAEVVEPADPEVPEGESDEESHAITDDLTPNGGTDLSDGNPAQPAATDDESAHVGDGGSTTVSEQDAVAEDAIGDAGDTTAVDAGASEGSGDDPGPANSGE